MVEEKPFRVLLDLSELNISLSKYVWMNVSPRELHNIEDFKNAVLKKLNFERRDIKLFVHDGLLPEDEKIIILRENDTIKLQYDEPVALSSSFCVLNTTKISNEDVGENSEVKERKDTKKRKRTNEEVGTDTEETISTHKKKSKHSRSVSLEDNVSVTKKSHKKKFKNSNNLSLENDISSPNENEIMVIAENNVESPVKNKELEISFNIHHDTVLDVQETTLNTSQGNNCKKHKRKRKRKRKTKSEVLSVAPYNIISDENTQANSTTTFTDNYADIRKHIRFTSPPPNLYTFNDQTGQSNTNTKSKSLNASESFTSGSSMNKSSPSMNSTSTSKANAQSLNTSESFTPVSLPTKSPCANSTPTFKANSKLKSLNSSENFNPGSPLNKSPCVNSTPSCPGYEQDSWNVSPMTDEKSKVSAVSSNKDTYTKSKKQFYADYPPLNCLPSEGTHIAFKTLDLDESYCPVVTPYKEGIVRKVNTKTEELFIEYLFEEVKSGRNGKFENLGQDEIPSDEIIKDVTIKWSSLIEPRCVKY